MFHIWRQQNSTIIYRNTVLSETLFLERLTAFRAVANAFVKAVYAEYTMLYVNIYWLLYEQ